MIFKYLLSLGCFVSRQPFFFTLFLSVLFLLSACSNKEEVRKEEQTLLEVNGIKVSVEEFQSKYIKRLIKTGQNDTKEGRYQFMNEFIDNLVLADKSDEKGLLDHPIYLSALNYQKRKSMMDFYFVDEMDKLIEAPTDDEVRLAYAKRERKVFVRQLFSLNQADLLNPYTRLKEGEDFVDVANDFFKTPQYDSLAGYLGPISYFGADDAFAEVAFSLNPGEFSEPIRSLFGYHIVFVEYIEFPAMLTEDAYQYRKSGVTSQVRLRKQRLVSNNYVRDLMSTLNVQVDVDNLKTLREGISNIEGDGISNTTQEQEQESDFWDDQRLESLSSSMDLEAVLSTFVLSGNRIEFTFQDYLNWLPYLSFSESEKKTGVSLGRALRNEVFYLIADESGYEEDKRVNNEVISRGYEVLSDLYQYELAMEAISDTNSIDVPDNFKQRLIRDKEIQISASYWKIPVATLKDAEEAKKDIQDEGGIPLSYDSYSELDYGIIEPRNDDYNLIKKGIVGIPTIANSKKEGWMLLYISKKDVSDINVNTISDNLESRYKVFSRINGEIESFRKEAQIRVDTLLFNEIYNLNKKSKED